MKLAIIGCRWYTDWDKFQGVLREYSPKVTEVISGGATGADRLAEKWATDNGIPFTAFPADWARYGKSAGPIRNRQIIESSDQVLAFWDGESKGTWDSIRVAIELSVPVDIIPISKPGVS